MEFSREQRDRARCDMCRAVSMKMIAADRMADEVAALVRAGRLDARSAAADRLLDFRNPPQTTESRKRGDRIRQAMVELESRPFAGVVYSEEWDALRREHVPFCLPAEPSREECQACGWLWPCPTIRLMRVLRLSDPFPLQQILERLCDAVDHLLDDHSCDTHGHEGIRYAQQAGRYVARLMNTPPDNWER